MKRKSPLYVLFVSLFVFVLTSCSSVNKESQVKNQPFTSDKIKSQVDSLYSRMTLEEKVSQLTGIRTTDLLVDNKLSLEKCRELIPNGIGHICQFACMQKMTPNELRDYVKELQHYLITETPSGIPAIFHEEAITGFATYGATTFPQEIGVACTWNPELVLQKNRFTAMSMRESGATMALSPMVDVVRTPHFNRVEESFGEDSYLSGAMAVAFVEGLQGDDLKNGVAATTKHFLGYGGGSEVEDKELYEEILFPHEVAIRLAGSKSVMTGYHKFRGEYAIYNKYLMQHVLREYLGFDGIMVSDYGSVSKAWMGGGDDGIMKRGVKALKAGNEMEFSSGISAKFIPKALKEGLLSEARFEEAVKRALTLKANLGLLDKNAKLYSEGNLDFDKPEYRENAYKTAVQSIVVLKNNGILPLKKSSKIALVGPNANSPWCMLGDYTYQSMFAFWQGGKVDFNNPKIYPLYESLKSKIGDDYILNYARGCDWSSSAEANIDKKSKADPRTEKLKMMLISSSDPTNWDEAISLAKKNDVIIAAVGENPTLCGEGRSRKGIRLPGDQEKFVNELIETGKPVVLVMFGGRAQVLNKVTLDKAAAIVEAWYPGEEGGNAVADILLGNENPSGKMCVSYPLTDAKGSICYNYGSVNDKKVAFPFGHGLSYTSFEYSKIKVNSKTKISSGEVHVSFYLKNTGNLKGMETAQLYICPTEKNKENYKPIQLKGFTKVKLEVGESKIVNFSLPSDLFAYYNKDGKWEIDPGKFEIKIGSSSRDIRLRSFVTLKGNKIVKNIRSNYFSIASVK